MTKLTIATRGSPLAVWQAEHVAERLRSLHSGLEVELLRIKTQGDKFLDAPLAKVGGKGLFVKELQVAMLEGRADIAVHSMKDVPVEFPDGLHLPVIMERADPRDALVSPKGHTIDNLPEGAVLGTSSLRRQCQLRRLRPDCKVVNLRGNVQTRLAKLESGQFDATVLAYSGLQRLGLESIVSEVLEPEQMLPAIGQGALGIECRAGDERVNDLIAPLAHPLSSAQVRAERAVNAKVGGGCQAPIAAFAEPSADGAQLQLKAMVSALNGQQQLLAVEGRAAGDAEALGQSVGDSLLGQGAEALLQSVFQELEQDGGAP